MNKKGFTLIELLAVIAILGLLVTIAIVSVSKNREKINQKEKEILTSTIVGAFQNYRVKNSTSDETQISFTNLKFTNNLNYNNIECKDTTGSSIKYVRRGKIENTNSLEEMYCIKLVCNGKTIINDYETNEYCGIDNGITEEGSEDTNFDETKLVSKILGKNNSNVVTTENGLYKSTATNSGKPTYYYKGNVENNYVDFANLIWRVVRINEDGTIRLISDNIKVGTQFNPTGNNLKNMYYTESNIEGGIMKALNDWYSANLLNYDSKIALSTYCEAAKVKYITTSTTGNAATQYYEDYTPNFRCPEDDGNGYGLITNQKIGLITIDELIHSAIDDGTGLYSTYINSETIGMSPEGVSEYGANVWGYFWNNIYSTMGVTDDYYGSGLPVINLKADTKVSGLGTNDSPWVVQTN